LIGHFKLPISAQKFLKQSTSSEGGKTAFGQNTTRIVKIQDFQPIYGKMPLDNKAAIRYLNSGCWHHNENWRWVSGPTTDWDSTGYSTQPKI